MENVNTYSGVNTDKHGGWEQRRISRSVKRDIVGYLICTRKELFFDSKETGFLGQSERVNGLFEVEKR